MNHFRPHLLALLAALLPATTAHAQSAPAAPTGLAAAPLDAQAALTWNDPSDSTITGYSVRSSTSLPVSGTWTAIASSGATTTSHTVASLTNGTRYYFEIRATNANGNSAASNTATIQLAASPSTTVTIPDANLRAALERAMGKVPGAAITQLDMATLSDTRRHLCCGTISDVSGLEFAINILKLSLDRNPISDLSPLAGLTSLRELHFQSNPISDLSPLAGLTSLEDLQVSFSRSFSDVSPLAGLTSLRDLTLWGNSISDVSPLAGLTSLTSLELTDNSVSDLSPLERLTYLRYLFLADNPIRLSDVPLASFPHLLGLGLSGSWLSDSFLSMVSTRYPRLWVLVLKGGRISDLTPLAGQAELWRLRLEGNAISDLSPLAGLTELRYLRLDENAISNLSPLADLALRKV